MRTYPPIIAGSPAPVESWIHGVRAEALLDDLVVGLRLKRELDRGARHDGADHHEVFGRCGVATPDQIGVAFSRARDAVDAWSTTPFETRIELATRFHDRLAARSDELYEILLDEGHPRRLIDWEVEGMLHATSPASMELLAADLRRERTEGDRTLLHLRRPDGVVALSPPGNAAAANSVAGVPILVAGNCLVVQAPRSAPLGVLFLWTELVAPLLDELGAPPGVLSVLCAETREFLDLALEDPAVDDLFFFGGSERGIRIGEEAVRRGKKPILELAGNDGLLIWRDADLDGAVAALAENFLGSAQICMVPKYGIVHPDVADEVLERLVDLAASARPGYPRDDDALLSPVLRADDYFQVLGDALDAGAELLCGGLRIDLDGSESHLGAFIAPTVVKVPGLDLAGTLECVRAETFYPLLPVIVPTADEAADDELLARVIGFLNGNDYGLRNSAWTADPAVIDTLVASVRNGGLLKINDSHVGFVPHMGSHGGPGRTGGPFGELNYPHLRTTHLQGVVIRRPAQAGVAADPERSPRS